MRIAINGFGRIGRLTLRAFLQRYPDKYLDIVAVNDLGDPAANAHLFRYDSNYGKFDGNAEFKENGKFPEFLVNGHQIAVLNFKDIKELPWADLGVDLVIESTGVFAKRADLEKHLEAGARHVILTAPSATAGDVDLTVVMGVNHKKFDRDCHKIISNASCTTNCLAPVVKILNEGFGVEQGMMVTTHSYTNDQRVQDLIHKDLRRARAAAVNIIPSTTGAAKAIGLVIPHLAGKILGDSLRVPVSSVSVVDFVATVVGREASAQAINEYLKNAAGLPGLKEFVEFSNEPLVSSDFKGNSHSSIIDGLSTIAGGNMVKVRAWYDNEWGYSCRVADLSALISGIKFE